jgi:hypothetical protein
LVKGVGLRPKTDSGLSLVMCVGFRAHHGACSDCGTEDADVLIRSCQAGGYSRGVD